MQTTLLQAIFNIAQNPAYELMQKYGGRNRINGVGDALERFIQDGFANTFNEVDEARRLKKLEATFSYLGNQNNPPDIIIKGGDAIEVKKVQSLNSAIALNSSFPKSKLYADDPLITTACRTCEEWTEKDIIYTIGVTTDTDLQHLFMIYGDCFLATKAVYESREQDIKNLYPHVNNVDFSARPLEPVVNLFSEQWISERLIVCLMRKSKFGSFPLQDYEALTNLDIEIQNVELLNPDVSSEELDAILISA